MSDDNEPAPRSALIIGCGFLGRPLARRLRDRSRTVWATTRSADRARELAECDLRPLIIDIHSPLTLANLRPALEAGPLDVWYLVPPGRPGQDPGPRKTVHEALPRVVEHLGDGDIHRAVMASSTGVYGDTDGESVNADTRPDPDGDRAQLLLDAEAHWLKLGDHARVVRLAGLYGPNRIIGLRAVMEGAPLVGDPDALLNLLHVDDAADLLHTIVDRPANAVELASDGAPAPRRDYYRALANRLNQPAPEEVDDPQRLRELGIDPRRMRRRRSKRCDPGPTMSRTGWEPTLVWNQGGLEQALAQSGPRS
ncbi:MAG: NAD-dependent epimerase/dehydratase family protein [Phycisphaeraceae bacterium]|nr:NAD-dependent epimerase/dehydratase family protein [Phycisphaeraceae bacterium]